MKKFLFVISIPLVVAILGALLTEYVLKIGVLGTANFKYFLIAAVVAAIFIFIVSKKIIFSVPAAIGVMLIPYVVFLIGQIDFYMVDANLAEGITVIEVRPTMDNIIFGSDK